MLLICMYFVMGFEMGGFFIDFFIVIVGVFVFFFGGVFFFCRYFRVEEGEWVGCVVRILFFFWVVGRI